LPDPAWALANQTAVSGCRASPACASSDRGTWVGGHNHTFLPGLQARYAQRAKSHLSSHLGSNGRSQTKRQQVSTGHPLPAQATTGARVGGHNHVATTRTIMSARQPSGSKWVQGSPNPGDATRRLRYGKTCPENTPRHPETPTMFWLFCAASAATPATTPPVPAPPLLRALPHPQPPHPSSTQRRNT